jgi:hypothetical protein
MGSPCHLIVTLVYHDGDPAQERYPALQDFAWHLAHQMQIPLVLVWDSTSVPPILSLDLGRPDGGWDVCRGTAEEIARWRHALGIYY